VIDQAYVAQHPHIGSLKAASGARRRHRLTIFLPPSLIERLRNAVYWTEQRTMAQIIVDAVEDAVSELEGANGGVFPARLAPLKPGRPRRRRITARPAPVDGIAAERP
jgi:hypothetical protein